MNKMNSPLFMFFAAKEYFENGTNYASKYFEINKNGEVKPFDGITHAKLCVPATNISFSVELAFKAVLKHQGVKKTGHDLTELYNLINTDTKDRIIKHYKSHNIYKNYIMIRLIYGNGTTHGSRQHFYHTSNDEEFVKNMLDTHKIAFLNFRYLHEFNEKQEWYFYFKEFSNFGFSVLSILGEMLDLRVESVTKKSY